MWEQRHAGRSLADRAGLPRACQTVSVRVPAGAERQRDPHLPQNRAHHLVTTSFSDVVDMLPLHASPSTTAQCHVAMTTLHAPEAGRCGPLRPERRRLRESRRCASSPAAFSTTQSTTSQTTAAQCMYMYLVFVISAHCKSKEICTVTNNTTTGGKEGLRGEME